MKKKIPYITAVLIVVLAIVLEVLKRESANGNSWNLGIAGAVALLLFGAAWKRGRDPEKPFWQAILFSLGGLFSPVIAQMLTSGFEDIEFAAIAELLLFLLPVAGACVIGHFTRKQNLVNSVRTMLNAIPGVFLASLLIGLVLSNCYTIQGFLVNLVPIAFIILVTLFSAYAEAQMNLQKRRKVQWNCWRLSLLLDILIGIKSFSHYFYYDHDCYIIYNTLLRVTLPLLLWQYKKWLNKKAFSQNMQTLLYLSGAFLLTILQSGGLHYMMVVNYLYLSAEWILIGMAVALAVYWQKPEKLTAAGVAGSVILAVGNFGLLFAKNDRLREIFYDLGGPAIHINLSSRADWLGYHMNTVQAYISGNFMPYAFPITAALLLLTIVTAILLVKYAGNRKMAAIFAVSMSLQAVISFAESIALVATGIGLPFTGYYIVDLVLLKWLLSSKKENYQHETS